MLKSFVINHILSTFALAIKKYRGVEQLVARQAHNLKVVCSSQASATKRERAVFYTECCSFLLIFYTMIFLRCSFL